MSERPAPVSVLAAWAAVVLGVPLATTAWLSTTIPDDPLRDAARPVVGAEPGDAVDGAGPRSRAAMRRALDGLVVTTSPRATPGYHLRVAGLSTEVVLTDAAGVVRHRWTAERDSFGTPSGPNQLYGVFREAHLREDGGLYLLVEGVGVVAIDRDGAFEWSARSKAHDHLAVMPDGHLLVLEAEVQPIPELSRLRVYLIDSVVEVDPTSDPPGKSVRRVDLLKAYRKSEVRWQRDPEVNALFGAVWFEVAPDGTCHVALRERGAVAVLDLQGRRLVREDTGAWTHVGPIRFGPDGGRYVVDHSPGAPMVVWGPDDTAAYTVDTPFEPSAPGWLQLLPSGHALVSPGVVRELDPGGAVVYAVDSPDHPPLGVAQDQWLPPDCCAWLPAEAP